MKHRSKRLLCILLSLALALSLFPAISLTAYAALPEVTYLDADGNEQTCTNYEKITSTNPPTRWGANEQTTWYVVEGNVSITDVVTVTGNVNLILCDKATLTVSGGQEGVITGEADPSLTIYAQSTGADMGALKASGTVIMASGGVLISGGTVTAEGGSYGINANTVTVEDGEVTATSTGEYGIGIYANETVTIDSGEVTASGTGDNGYGIFSSNTVTINGGSVTAIGSGSAIYGTVKNAVAGTGWTNTDGTEGKADIAVSTAGQTISNDYKKVQFPAVLDPVSYMDWDGSKLAEQTGDNACKSYTVVTSDTTAFEDGKWYVVSSDVTVSDRITVSGTAHLILCDVKTLTASSGIEVGSGNTLNIYGQSGGTGALVAKAANGNDDDEVGGSGSTAISGGALSVSGAAVTATGGNGGQTSNSQWGHNGSIGKAITGTITAASAKESEDNSNWSVVSGSTSDKQYVVIDGTPSHTHEFTYSASGATITATCNGSGTCDITTGLTLTISAPTGDLTADGTKTFPAALSTGYNTTAFPGTYAITYTKDGQPFNGTPKDSGAYVASVTVGEGDGAATASVSYTITAPAAETTTTVVWSSATGSFDQSKVKIAPVDYEPSWDEDGSEWDIGESGGEGEFTTSDGVFTKIEISGGWRGENFPKVSGWSGDTWTGAAQKVKVGGRITSDSGKQNFTITFTIEPLVLTLNK